MPAASEEAGRVSMRFEGVTVPELPDPGAIAEEMPAELDARLAAINARAANANAAFVASAEDAQQLAYAARGADIESDRWAEAQLSLADLTSLHSEGRLALADLDVLAASAQVADAQEADLNALADMQASLVSLLDDQARFLEGLNAQLEQSSVLGMRDN